MEDHTLIKELIFGRVEPHIYAFSTGTIPNYETSAKLLS